MTHRHKLLTMLLLLMLATPVFAQDEPSPYDIALQRIEEAQRTNATELDLSGLGLTDLPPEIGNLNNLQWLNLNANQLTDLPSEIGQLTNLQELRLGGNLFQELPPSIGQLVNLQLLLADNNRLQTLPPEIGQLVNLRVLSVGFNELRELPPTIGQLTNLQMLTLIKNNELRELPIQVGNLRNLVNLHVSDNPLIYPPQQITEQGDLAIIIFLRDEYEKQQAEKKRLIIYSASGVGLIAAIMLGFRYRQQGRKSKKKRDDL